MKKWRSGVAMIMLCALAASMSLPVGIIIRFGIVRDRIEREVCVMRNAAPGENICHGNCYLMRQLHKAQERMDRPFENIEIRAYPAEPPQGPIVLNVMRPPADEQSEVARMLPQGAQRAIDHVPWKG